jgi:hypothetical protein
MSILSRQLNEQMHGVYLVCWTDSNSIWVTIVSYLVEYTDNIE